MNYGHLVRDAVGVGKMGNYQIFTDATADLSPALLEGLPDIEIIPMQVEIAGNEYTYGLPGGITAKEFYWLQREGNFATTTQINPAIYHQSFEPWLRRGIDVLYLCFSSGLSGTYQSAVLAIDKLREEYPERKIVCIDTLGATGGEGFLVREAAKMQENGLSFAELVEWVEMRKLKVCHWFTVDTFTHLRHGGRISAAAAVMGTALQIKPLLHVDEVGKLQVVEKVRGRNKAFMAQVARMEQGWTPELGKFVLIGHADDFGAASILREKVLVKFPDAEVQIADIGPIIGAHTGPGALTLFYWGNNR